MKSLYGNNVNEFYVGLTRKNFEKRSRRLAAVRTKADAEKYIAHIRKKITKIFSFPERTPLNPKVTGCNSFDGFTTENLYYYSRPDYPVSANFYLPAKREGKLPGILLLCGHSPDGKAAVNYHTACIGFALKGFAVLCIDPVEQGERKQYPDGGLGLCGNHNLMGKNLSLCGEWFGGWRTWDAIRALDYMETRPEVDMTCLGVIGCSGGGTLTTWVGAVDPRPSVIAPSCYITNWKHNVENELPADIEQMPPHALEYGLEMGDFLLAQGARDILMLGQKNDFFDPRGMLETFEEVRKVNSLFGKETAYFIGPQHHGLCRKSREAAYGFFTRLVKGKEDAAEPVFPLPPASSTYAFKDGTVRNLPGSRLQRELTAELGDRLTAEHRKHSKEELRSILMKLLNISMPEAPYYRVLRYQRSAEHIIRSRFGLETEPGIIMSVLALYSPDDLYHIDTENKKIRLYIPHLDSMEELRSRPLSADEMLCALDIRGIGEMMPSGTDQPKERNFFAPYQADYHYAALAIMYGKPVIGGKVHDILSAVELLAGNGTEITLEAKGLGCVPALLAAVLSDKVAHLELDGIPESFRQILKETISEIPLSCMVPGILKFTDLPELKDAVREKILRCETVKISE